MALLAEQVNALNRASCLFHHNKHPNSLLQMGGSGADSWVWVAIEINFPLVGKSQSSLRNSLFEQKDSTPRAWHRAMNAGTAVLLMSQVNKGMNSLNALQACEDVLLMKYSTALDIVVVTDQFF